MPLQMTVTKDELERSLVRDSFEDFLLRFWDTVIAEPLSWNWHMSLLCRELQTVAERVLRREPKEYDLIINVPPGTSKSTIASEMFPVWLWTRDPSIRTICGSYAFPLSLHLASLSRRILMSEKFRRLFPEVILMDEQKALLSTSAGGQRIATSTGGSITGMHGHFLIIDDPVNPKEAASDVELAAANDWIDHTLMTRKVDKLITPLILIQQRLHQNDPTGHVLNKGGAIRHICLPAELSPSVRPRSMRKHYRDGLMDPIRLSRRSLDEAKRDLGDYAYSGQFDQSPIPKGGGMFRIDKIELVPQEPKEMVCVRFWDKAGTGGGGAYTVGVKMGRNPVTGDIYVIDVVRGQWEASTRERIIRQTAEADGRNVIVGLEQEPGSGGKESAQATVRNLAGWCVRTERPTGDKVTRADPFAVQVNSGNVKMVVGEWNRAYLNELQFFPYSTYKDQVDASSGAFLIVARARMFVGAL